MAVVKPSTLCVPSCPSQTHPQGGVIDVHCFCVPAPVSPALFSSFSFLSPPHYTHRPRQRPSSPKPRARSAPQSTTILAHHLQRILDSPPPPFLPLPVVPRAPQKYNFIAASVSPGINHVDTVVPLLNGD
ncbi:hypothetical protein C8J57DRAFT_1537985 [Mycena rebaudengoi]|nr:hypothetical protein C8J57DRAFT_1537985 [Mycena rebaudengoi]